MKTYQSTDDVFADGMAICGVDVLRDTVLVRHKDHSFEIPSRLIHGSMCDATINGKMFKVCKLGVAQNISDTHQSYLKRKTIVGDK